MTAPEKTFAREQIREAIRVAYVRAIEAQVAVNNYLMAARDAKDAGLTDDELEQIFVSVAEAEHPKEGADLIEGANIFATILEALVPRARRKPSEYEPPPWSDLGEP